VPALRVPERVKDWLSAGVALEEVMVMVVGVRASTAGVALQHNNAQTTSTTVKTITTLFSSNILTQLER